jgi:TM2 domain-containing membrane protein YozV
MFYQEVRMYCAKCGTQLENMAQFCPACGTPVRKPEAASKLFCSSCGKELIGGGVFCPSCGAAVRPAAAAAPPPSAYAPPPAAPAREVNININQGQPAAPPPPVYAAPAAPVMGPSPKSRTVVTILAWFLGSLGVHRFYLGKVGTGIAMLFTVGGLGIWQLIDFIMAVAGKMKDKQGRVISNWSNSSQK